MTPRSRAWRTASNLSPLSIGLDYTAHRRHQPQLRPPNPLQQPHQSPSSSTQQPQDAIRIAGQRSRLAVGKGTCVCHCEQICSYDDLLQNLSLSDSPGARVRPVKDWRTPSIVLVNMFLYSIISLVWDNEFVYWNPDDFCGIEKMFVPTDYFWKPDIYIDEMTEDDHSSPDIPYCFIYHNGTIVYAVPLRIISSCNLDMYKFPFDTQTCSLSFGSYVHTVNDIVMVPSSSASLVLDTSLEIFANRGDWSLLDMTVSNETYEAEGDLYNKVIYEITIKRTPTFFIINLIAPACLLVMLDIFGMFIQIESEERLGFKITVVLGFSVLLLILTDLIPSSGSTPVLGIFCGICMLAMVSSLVGCIGTSYMLSLGANQPNVSPWIRTWVLRRFARVLCFKKIYIKEDQVTVAENKISETDDNTEKYMEILEIRKSSTKETSGSPEVKLLNKMLADLLEIHQKLFLSKKEEKLKSEWHSVALVLDRLVFIVYLLTVITILVVVAVIWAT
ncbi:5-hydroxytryptamine receptor 3A-like [Discoglossus pictus]